jgi:predicted flap endonuclease-1-like 5' DNA nuclease
MPCSGCRKRAPSPVVQNRSPIVGQAIQSNTALERSLEMNDSDFVMITYQPGRRGTHGVIGVAVFQNRIATNMAHVRGGWVFNYGYRSEGDRFLVHRNDVAQAKSLFMPVETQQAVRKIQVPTAQASQPPAPAQHSPQVQSEPPVAETKPASPPEPTPEPVFDPQILPGVTPMIAERLLESGYDSLEKIAASGEELQDISGIGPAKLELILEAARGMLEQAEAEPASEEAVLSEIAKMLGE